MTQRERLVNAERTSIAWVAKFELTPPARIRLKKYMLTRRSFFIQGAPALAGTLCLPDALLGKTRPPWFRISLAQWSLHRSLGRGGTKLMDNLDFAAKAKKDFGIEGVEYVNQFFPDKAKDNKYLAEMKKRANDAGVKNLLIMIDREGNLGEPDAKARNLAVENHYKWVEAAKVLGCHSIRVNARSKGTYDEQLKLAADGLSRLTRFADKRGINVIVENHGGLSSNGKWLASVIKRVNHARCGALPDFGNFRIKGDEWYDRYRGVRELMPFAKAVSAKSHNFDEKGNETTTDYFKMMKIVKDAGYRSWVGIEYEGRNLPEDEGIRLTKALLEKAGKNIG